MFYQWCCYAEVLKVRMRFTSAYIHIYILSLCRTHPTKLLYAARPICSAGEGILLFFQRRSGEVKFHSFSPGSGALMATAYIQQTDVVFFSPDLLFGVGTSGADLRACVFLLLGCSSPRCCRGKSQTSLLWLWPYSSWKWACIFLFWFCSWSSWDSCVKWQEMYESVCTVCPEGPRESVITGLTVAHVLFLLRTLLFTAWF